MQCKCKRLWRQIKTIVYLVHSPHALLFSIHHMPQIAKLFQIQISCTKKPNGLWSVSFSLFHTWTAYSTYHVMNQHDYIWFFSMLDFCSFFFEYTQLNSVTDFFVYSDSFETDLQPVYSEILLLLNYFAIALFLTNVRHGRRHTFQFIWLSFKLFFCCYCFR